MDEPATDWAYANNWRIAAAFLGLAIAFLGIGVLVVSTYGDEAGFAGATLLTIATFLLVFSVLVFLPRLAHRGSVSFSLLARRSMDDAERAVRDVIEATGRAPRVEVAKSRSPHPPRIVIAEGVSLRFRIEATRSRKGEGDEGVWTEIVQSVTPAAEEQARALRELIASRLSRGPFPAE